VFPQTDRQTQAQPICQVKANIVEPNDYINNGVLPQTDTSLTHGQMKANIVDPSGYINNGVFLQTDTSLTHRLMKANITITLVFLFILHLEMQRKRSHRLTDKSERK